MNVVNFPKPSDNISPHLRQLADEIEEEGAKAVFILIIDPDCDLRLQMMGTFSNIEVIGALKVAEDMILGGMDYD